MASRAGWPSARPTNSATPVAETPLTIHDIHATILHQLGLDHEKLTFRFGGRDFSLTDVHGRVLTNLLV